VNDTQVLAHILAGEVGLLCPFEASLAIAFMFMSGRNRTWSGWDETPDVQHWWLSYTYWQFDDPTPTARFMFSRADTLLPSVQRIIGHDPPLRIFECQNGLALYAY